MTVGGIKISTTKKMVTELGLSCAKIGIQTR